MQLKYVLAFVMLSNLAVSTLAFAEPCPPVEPAPVNLVDPDACKATPLALSGPDTWAANTTWTATGGVGPYEFTAGFPLVAGTGTSTADASHCGTQTITATDRCGKSASMQVQMVGGTWIAETNPNSANFSFVYSTDATVQACVSSRFGYYTPYNTWKTGYGVSPISAEQTDSTHIKYTFSIVAPNAVIVGFNGHGAYAYGQPDPGVSGCYGQPAKNIWCRGEYAGRASGYKNSDQIGVWIHYSGDTPFWAENFTVIEDWGSFAFGQYDIYTLDGNCAKYASQQTGYQILNCSK